MRLPKYNLTYNTRDLIKSLAQNTSDRKYKLKTILHYNGLVVPLYLEMHDINKCDWPIIVSGGGYRMEASSKSILILHIK